MKVEKLHLRSGNYFIPFNSFKAEKTHRHNNQSNRETEENKYRNEVTESNLVKQFIKRVLDVKLIIFVERHMFTLKSCVYYRNCIRVFKTRVVN